MDLPVHLQSIMPVSSRSGLLGLVLLGSAAALWVGCDSPAGPSPDAVSTNVVRDTVFVSTPVTVYDTVRLTSLPDDGGVVRIEGPLAWGGGPEIGSSAGLVSALPGDRWGIGTDDPQSRLHIEDGALRIVQDPFTLFTTGLPVGENPAGFGIYMNRRTDTGGAGGLGFFPMGITYQQDDENTWGTGLDENVIQSFPDYVSVFERTAGDVFRFRQGGRAILGNGVSQPEPHHVLTLIDRKNDYIDNVLNLQTSPDGSAKRFLQAYRISDHSIRFAVGNDGSVGVGRDVSATSRLAVNGSVEAHAFVRLSDARLKEDVTGIDTALDRILGLRPVQYDWVDDVVLEGGTGLIAQEVKEVIPEVVHVGEDGMHRVDYQGVNVFLLRAVQELTDEVRQLQADVERLRRER